MKPENWIVDEKGNERCKICGDSPVEQYEFLRTEMARLPSLSLRPPPNASNQDDVRVLIEEHEFLHDENVDPKIRALAQNIRNDIARDIKARTESR